MKETTVSLSKEALTERLRQVGLTLAFDTNAVESTRRFLNVCDSIAQLNAGRDESAKNRLVVYAIAHGEKLLHMRQKHDPRSHGSFSEDRILASLTDKGIEILPFAESHARRVAALLAKRYPTQEAWWDRKRSLYAMRLGLSPGHLDIKTQGRRCGATVDWLIAAHAECEGHLLITNDTGEEFTELAYKAKLQTLEYALGELGVWVSPPGRS